jgi:hypothetical protein
LPDRFLDSPDPFVHPNHSSVHSFCLSLGRTARSVLPHGRSEIHFIKSENNRYEIYLSCIKRYASRGVAPETGFTNNSIPIPYESSYNCRCGCWFR